MLLSERLQSKVLRLRIDALKERMDKSQYKVGDTKQKNGKTYVFNENKRWSLPKDKPTESLPEKKKSSSRKKKADPTPDTQKVLEDVKTKVAEEKPKKARKTKAKAEPEAPQVEKKPKSTRKTKTETKKTPQDTGSPQKTTASSFQVVMGSTAETDKANKELSKSLDEWQKTGKKLYEKDKEAYGGNYGIINSIAAESYALPEQIRGVKDKNGNMQAIASVYDKDKSIHVAYLATAPWNIKPGDKRQTKGSGTAMMEEIIMESVKKGKGGRITLEALPGAISFYEKIGFKGKGQSEGYDDGVIDMELSPAAAKEFLKKRGRPID